MIALLKRNIGTIAYFAVCVILCIVLAVLLIQRKGKLQEAQEKIDEHKQFLERVQGMDLALTEDNLNRLQEKHEKVSNRVEGILTDLREKYYVPRGEDKSPIEALRSLQRAVEDLEQKFKGGTGEETTDDEAADVAVPLVDGEEVQGEILERTEEGLTVETDEGEMTLSWDQVDPSFAQRPIELGSGVNNFTFGDRLEGLPERQNIPNILKNVQIVEGLTDMIVDASPESLQELNRMTGLELVEENLYNIATFSIKATGTLPQTNRLVNKIHSNDPYLFIIRNIKMKAGGTGVNMPEEDEEDRDTETETDEEGESEPAIAIGKPDMDISLSFEYIEFPPDETDDSL